jgi:leucyl aminopeptidase (aminopeptidase T)
MPPSGRQVAVSEDSRLASLRDDIVKMLAGALETEQRHASEMERRDHQHIAEAERRDELHVQELHRRDDLHAHEMEMIREALETRDTIGQAKGVIMAALSCSPDEAFRLLRQQSQHENRKLVEVAAEIARRASSRVDGPYRRTGPP